MSKQRELEKEVRSIGSMTEDTCLISASVGMCRPTEKLIDGIPDIFTERSIFRKTKKANRRLNFLRRIKYQQILSASFY